MCVWPKRSGGISLCLCLCLCLCLYSFNEPPAASTFFLPIRSCCICVAHRLCAQIFICINLSGKYYFPVFTGEQTEAELWVTCTRSHGYEGAAWNVAQTLGLSFNGPGVCSVAGLMLAAPGLETPAREGPLGCTRWVGASERCFRKSPWERWRVQKKGEVLKTLGNEKIGGLILEMTLEMSCWNWKIYFCFPLGQTYWVFLLFRLFSKNKGNVSCGSRNKSLHVFL